MVPYPHPSTHPPVAHPPHPPHPTHTPQDAKDDANAGTRALLPSAWVKREQKYKSDLENYEMTIIAQQEQVAALERELQSLRDGEQAKALEERLKVGGVLWGGEGARGEGAGGRARGE